MKLPVLLVAGLTLILVCCKDRAKADKRVIYNEDFKWSITIPPNFDTVSAAQWATMQNRGAEAIEKTFDAKVENYSRTIFVFQNNQFNYFEANYQPFDTAVDGNYDKTMQEVINIVYGTFEAQMPGAKMDSSSTTATISGLKFHNFNLNITLPNQQVMKWQMFGRLFGKKDLTINIMTMDKEKEKELMNAWMNSTFGN